MRSHRLLLATTSIALVWGGAAVWVDRVGVGPHAARPPSCAIVVPGARVDEGGVPSATLEARVRQGIALKRADQAAWLVFSGGVGEHPPAEAEIGRALALEAGVPEREVLVETASHSTRENARETARLLAGRGVGCVQVVSDPYHLARARWAFEREGLSVSLAPVLDAPRHRSWPLRLWWTAREVPAFVKMILSE
ncbi:MAG: YdcF family protein [Myxococcaceae bacterium]|nr:YdcF family protein [Myxococcaceae bacterium]